MQAEEREEKQSIGTLFKLHKPPKPWTCHLHAPISSPVCLSWYYVLFSVSCNNQKNPNVLKTSV